MSLEYLKKVFVLFDMYKLHIAFVMLSVFMLNNSCTKKVENATNPTIEFISAYGYTYSDTTLLIGDNVKIGIMANSNGDDKLTQLNYTVETENSFFSIDSGMNTNSLIFNTNIEKGGSENEVWTFMVRDRYGKESEKISVKFKKDSLSTYGDIIDIQNLVLGAQNNSSVGSFYSFENLQVLTQNQAFLSQNLIDILYFYDYTGDENTISSPNGNIGAFPANSTDTLGMLDWSIRNVTRFVKLETVSISEFDNATNDSLLLANTFIFPIGKRKAKNLQSGDLYAFMLNDETTKGIIKVLNVTGTNQGNIEIDIKIQDPND